MAQGRSTKNHFDDSVDSDQQVVNKEVSIQSWSKRSKPVTRRTRRDIATLVARLYRGTSLIRNSRPPLFLMSEVPRCTVRDIATLVARL